MFSYFKGILTDVQKPGNHKIILTLEVNQIGYEMQAIARLLPDLPPIGENVQIFCHFQLREDQMTLFGFGTRPERDLFRYLINVNGIGPQMALALLDTLGTEELVQAVVTSNTRLLARTPGVGSKTAERLVLELKAKLAIWRQSTGLGEAPVGGLAPSLQEEVEITLLALGYTPGEISQALQSVGRNTSLSKSVDPEAWVRAAIAWLSQ